MSPWHTLADLATARSLRLATFSANLASRTAPRVLARTLPCRRTVPQSGVHSLRLRPISMFPVLTVRAGRLRAGNAELGPSPCD